MTESNGASDHADSTRYERSDIRINMVVRFGVVLAVGLAAIMIGLWAMHEDFLARQQRGVRSQYPPVIGNHDRLPPQPRLEGIPPNESEHSMGHLSDATGAAENRREDTTLHSGWIDKKSGVFHPPIYQAMTEMLNRLGKQNQPKPTEFLAMPSDSSSGRMPRDGGKP